MAKKVKLKIIISKIATNTRSVLKEEDASVIYTPIPLFAPSHSEMTAPMTLYVPAIFKPENMEGSAWGHCNFQKICRFVAPVIFI